jgi:hypothetical protein
MSYDTDKLRGVSSVSPSIVDLYLLGSGAQDNKRNTLYITTEDPSPPRRHTASKAEILKSYTTVVFVSSSLSLQIFVFQKFSNRKMNRINQWSSPNSDHSADINLIHEAQIRQACCRKDTQYFTKFVSWLRNYTRLLSKELFRSCMILTYSMEQSPSWEAGQLS